MVTVRQGQALQGRAQPMAALVISTAVPIAAFKFSSNTTGGVTPLAAPIALLPNLYTITFKRQGQV
ncbi:MAG: hypothetical protein R2865_03980 [Deinococcales bacterium]